MRVDAQEDDLCVSYNYRLNKLICYLTDEKNMPNHKYLNNETIYKEDTYLAFKGRFATRQEYESFYAKIKNDDAKNNFLRVGTTYLFFVKNGDWEVNVPRSNRLVGYFTNSFKLVALMAIIESLSNEKYEDFFQWIMKDQSNFPIGDKHKLDVLYKNYKKDYGSIKKCKVFFASLSQPIQNELCHSVSLDGKPLVSIEHFANLLYRTRSSFAHEVGTTNIFSGNHFEKYNKKLVRWKLEINRLLEIFEIGVLSHFEIHYFR